MKRYLILTLMVCGLLFSCKPDPETNPDSTPTPKPTPDSIPTPGEGEIDVLIPTISDVTVADITSSTAVFSAEVLSDGGAEVTQRGFYWTCTLEPDAECTIKEEVGSGLGNYEYEITDLESDRTYYVWAYAVNSAGQVDSDVVSFTTLKNEDDNGNEEESIYEAIDLGLPSGIKWASFNVGAIALEEYGDHFAWGELTTKEDYQSSNCVTNDKEIADISGNPEYDVAAASWGDGWRMPTVAEMNELLTECEWTWYDDFKKGVSGYKVESKTNDNFIFLPTSGFCVGTDTFDEGRYGYYWTSTPYEDNANTAAYYMDFNVNVGLIDWGLRRNGFAVRPVKD